ncbi:MFS transporter [Uliginosibacterium sp. 31-16]|uniref:MFS transporter n=1 Tax=Uliginosibacterium sp. 31-16 TaxID=3068315 RepID=UPI00273F11CC|nr:MFS transporter [Uliginosibacterium sp. 31-16]MDP5239587.1 MFS transporter [Uliginosibacterium sp. 31-16]
MPAVPFRRLSVYYFFYYAFIGIFMPYFALYLQSRGFPAAQIGLLLAVMQWMRLLAPNLWGWLADRLGRRMPVLRIAALISMLGYMCIGVSDSFWAIAAALAVMGFFWTAQSPLAEATTFGHLNGQPGYGAIRAWGSFGFVVSVLGTGWWLERASIDWVVHGGVGMLLAIVASSLLVPEAPRRDGERVTGGLWPLVRRPEVMALLASCMLMTAAHGALNVFYSIHLVAAGYSKSLVGLLWTLGVLAEILVFMLAPRLMARFALRHLLLFALAVAALRFALIGWGVNFIVIVLLMQLLHGITFGVNHIASVSAISRWFAGPHQAQGQALYGSISFGAGGIIGSLVSGWLWDSVGAGWTFTASSGFALLGFGVLWWGLRAHPENRGEKTHA